MTNIFSFNQIKDVGVGIADEKIQALLNVHRRLFKYYGKGLNIHSIIGQGTIVSFSIPLERREYFDKNNCCG